MTTNISIIENATTSVGSRAWPLTPLSQVCAIQPSKSEARDRLRGSDLVSFVPMEALGIQRKTIDVSIDRPLSEVASSYTYFADGDLLLAKITPCFENGKLGIASELTNGVGFGSSEYIVLRCLSSLRNDFLYYFLLQDSFRENGAKTMTGTAGQKRLTRTYVESIRLPLPSIAEQGRLVSVLDEAFEGIALAKANIERSRREAKALLASQVDTIFSAVQRRWPQKSLGSISKRVSVGHVGPTTQFYCEATDGIRFLRSQNVRPGRLDLDGVQYITRDFHEKLKKSQLQPGDLLFVRVGANRGDCCAVPHDIGVVNCANIVFARPTEGNSAYLECYCQSPTGRRLLLGMTTGSAQGVINTSSVAELMIPLPPSAEQQSIVAQVNRLQVDTDLLEALYFQKLDALEALKQSLLHQAFSGNL